MYGKAVYEWNRLWFVYIHVDSRMLRKLWYVVLDVLGDRRILSLHLKIVSFFHEMNVFVGKEVNMFDIPYQDMLCHLKYISVRIPLTTL